MIAYEYETWWRVESRHLLGGTRWAYVADCDTRDEAEHVANVKASMDKAAIYRVRKVKGSYK